MRTLKDILKESILDDIDTQIKTGYKVFKDEIKAFLKENFRGASSCKISRNPNSDGKYEVSSPKSIEAKNDTITSLTNGMFVWNKIDGDFKLYFCTLLKSLEGAPKEVGGTFDCSRCDSLKSLEGAPEKVGRNFYCGLCSSLESLKGAPEKVEGDFYCNFNKSLTSLEGAPKEVEGDFGCSHCKIKFTKDDVKKVSNVKRKIVC
jgi:hypothetical protein